MDELKHRSRTFVRIAYSSNVIGIWMRVLGKVCRVYATWDVIELQVRLQSSLTEQSTVTSRYGACDYRRCTSKTSFACH